MHQTLRFVYNNLMTSVFTVVLNHVMSHIPIHLLLIYITSTVLFAPFQNVQVLYSQLRGEYPSSLFLPLWPRREWDKSRIGSWWGHRPMMLWNRGYPLPLFLHLSLRREWNKPKIGSQWGHRPRMLWIGEYPLTPIIYPCVWEGSGASLGLVLDEVTVSGCFGTNRKIYKCHLRPITSLYILGCDWALTSVFRNGRDHRKTSKL